jgi:hypothetical protein
MAREEFNGVTKQRKAALKRLRDAQALLALDEPDRRPDAKGRHGTGAMYLGGYAIECKIKAIAMEVHRCRTLAALATKLGLTEDEVYVHGLEALLLHLLPTLYGRLQRSPLWRDFAGRVNTWRPAWRYDPRDRYNQVAAAFMRSVEALYAWLDSHRS